MITRYKTGLIWLTLIFAVSFGMPSFAETSGDQDTETSEQDSETSENASSDGAATGGGASDLATKLANPISSMISAPFQFNYDTGLGETDADRWILNIQPVFPFELNEDWNLISRTILPVIDLESPTVGGDDVSGVGDIVQSFFFSPKAPTKNGWIWGVGPVISIPIGKDEFTQDQWGLGPTFVALKQQGPWTYGALLNHVWGIDAPSDREDTNSSFLQPFIAYVTPNAWTFSVNSESIYDWNTEQWTVPVNAAVSKLTNIGKQPVSFQVGYRYYFEAPAGGPDWGLRFTATFLFPK
ncbi:MAG: transporter [Roseobacter sp.]|jgi:hypothetical protein|nr:transporter [Roseobacter sp.]